MKQLSTLGILLLLGLVVVLLLVPLPSLGRAENAFSNLMHAPVFAVLAYLVGRRIHVGQLRPRAVTIQAFLAVAVFGCLTEFLQALVGRSSSLIDACSNVIGAAVGVTWFWSTEWQRSGQRRAVRLACAILLVATNYPPLLILWDVARQYLERPRLGSFEQPLELSRWYGKECEYRRVQKHATHGHWSLQVRLRAGTYPGMAMQWPLPNWTGYNRLVFDVFLESREPKRLSISIKDVYHNNEANDRYNHRVVLRPGANRIEIPLSAVSAAPRGRTMRMDRITSFQLFIYRLATPQTIYLDNIRLEAR